MTTPVAHDYPDWGRQAAASDIIITDHPFAAIGGDLTDAVKFVGHLPYIFLFGIANAGLRITLEWYGDQAATQSIGSDRAEALANIPIFQDFPVRAPFVRQVTRLSAYPNSFGSTTSMMANPAAQYSALGVNAGADNLLISAINAGPLGGGANVTLTANAVRGGEAYFEADILNEPNPYILMYAVDYLGGITGLATITVASRGQPRNLHLPAQTIKVQLFNQDAGAFNYNAILAFKNFIH